jgi:hypothetical protein
MRPLSSPSYLQSLILWLWFTVVLLLLWALFAANPVV